MTYPARALAMGKAQDPDEVEGEASAHAWRRLRDPPGPLPLLIPMASETTSSPVPLRECAIVVHPDDNVAVVKFGLMGDESVALEDGSELALRGPVPPGHRFATRAVPAGEFVRQYGQPIGTSLGVEAGDPISHDNMTDEVPVVRELPEDLATPAPDFFEPSAVGTFPGYRRSDGRVGTRNHVLIVPASMCAAHEAGQIATLAEFTLLNKERFPNIDSVVAIGHNKGCGMSDGTNVDVMLRVLSNYADHPNVGGLIFMELGCEMTNLGRLKAYLKKSGLSFDKPVAWLGVQESGGTEGVIKAGLAAVEEMLPEVNEAQREECSVSELVLGVKCGGSDGFSGLSANPSLGHASDLLVRSGGTVLLTEVPEFCGAEHVLANRAKDADTGRDVYGLVDWYKEYAARMGSTLGENPSPGNKAGGLLNITIKSLGAIAKGGTTRVEGTVGYAERPTSKGLNLMLGPGYDQESTPGIIGSGATVVVFTTGRGTTIGNAIAPVIKLASNTRIYERMKGDLDLSAGGVVDGVESIQDCGKRVFEHVVEVAGGEPAHAERHKHREFQFWAEQSVSL